MDENEFVVMSTVSDAKPDPRGSLFCSDLGTEGDVCESFRKISATE